MMLKVVLLEGDSKRKESGPVGQQSQTAVCERGLESETVCKLVHRQEKIVVAEGPKHVRHPHDPPPGEVVHPYGIGYCSLHAHYKENLHRRRQRYSRD
jgi:hypothetical protein